MIQQLPAALQRLFRMGIPRDTSFIETQKSYMFNLFIMIGAPFALLSLGLNLYWQAYIPAAFNVIQLSIFCFGIYMSITRRWLVMRTVLLVLLSVIAAANAYYYKSGSEYRLMVMMIAALIFFDTHWKYFAFAALLCFIFAWIRIENMALTDMSPLEVFATMLKILIPLILFVMSLYYFKHLYFDNLSQLEISNTELSIAKEQKEKILNTVAHDLRSPINNITGICHLMMSDDKLTSEQKELVSLILHSSNSSLVLINDLLKKSDALSNSILLQQTDLNALIAQCVSLMELAAGEKNIRIKAAYFLGELQVNIDGNKIERVISNLVNNAIKFSPAGSVIQILLKKEQSNALIVIADQGVGIAKEDQEKVFDRFTHARRKGTEGEISFGIGLSICKQIVEQHGGSITLESEINKGTSFFIRLPLYQS